MPRPLLESRVGLRVLLMFVIAAGAPLLLLAFLSQRTLDDTFQRSEAAVLSGSAKAAGMQTMERLRVATQALLVAPTRVRPGATPRELPPLLSVVRISPGGRKSVLYGEADAAALLSFEPTAGAEAAPKTVTLHVAAGRPGDTAASVVLAVPGDGSEPTKLGLVNPGFLWQGADEVPDGTWLCVTIADAAPIFCSDPARAGLAQEFSRQATTRGDASSKSARWPLFFGNEFQSPDWSFVSGPNPEAVDAKAAGGRRTLFVAAAAGLLLAVLLSLVQIRRTLRPLATLTAGARALASRRFDTRLDIRSADEFGELAGAFNDMATRLEGQFGEIESLAGIDREIVDQRDLASIHARIVARLAGILPGRPVAIVHAMHGTAGPLHCHVNLGGAVRTVMATADAITFDSAAANDFWQHHGGSNAVPAFARIVIDADWPMVCGLPLRWGDRCFGFLLCGQRGLDDLDEEATRQISELRNRAAIAASTADRVQTLQWEAHHDNLTGLLNPKGLRVELRRLLAQAGPVHGAVALLFIDLDRFKSVNDRLGHEAGDQTLIYVAERLRGVMAAIPSAVDDCIAARAAGDEFVIAMQSPEAETQAADLARACCVALAQVFVVGDSAFSLGASVGVAATADPMTSPEHLLRSADQAMYEAKRQGGGRHEMHDHRVDASAARRAWIERELPLAADRGELRLLYQPRVGRVDGRVESVEALIRWQHPEHGLCMPGDFIPIAERSDLIVRLGRWVIDAACAQARAWQDQGLPEVRIAVNLSARQLGSDELLADLDAAFLRHGIPTRLIELEITESMFVEQTDETVERLRGLRDRGLMLALDDFGTGYSSLSYLRSLPIDVLKIDRAFVVDLATDPSAIAVASAIVALATALGMRTVAEGVETVDQLRLLTGLGCDEFQGYLFSRPIQADALAPHLLSPASEWLAFTGKLRAPKSTPEAEVDAALAIAL